MLIRAQSAPSPRTLRLDPAGGKGDQFGHSLQVELLFDTRAMGFNGLGAQMKFIRDLHSAFAATDELKDFPFPVAQALDRRSIGTVADNVLEDSSRHFVAQINPAGQDLANCLHHHRTAFLFHDVTAGARPQDPLSVERFLVHRDDEDQDGML